MVPVSAPLPDGWPANIWIGTSVENQKYAPRLTVLARLPAPVRFVSAEPLLAPLDLTPWLADGTLHWVIAGGESGPGARPMPIAWVRALRDQSVRTDTPFFLKQLGGVRNKRGGGNATVDGRLWRQLPNPDRVDVTMPDTGYGGQWTRDKLAILKKYLDAYTTALKGQPFRLIYVDAFAGSGFWSPRSVRDVEPTEFRKMWEGSAKIALDVDNKPFDRLVFIEKDENRCNTLHRLASHHTNGRVEIVNEDANKAIPNLCDALEPYDRAVVFLDPFATEVSWDTVVALAETTKVDCWILFPLGAIARLMPRKRDPDPELARHLDRIFGGREHWRSLYQDALQLGLFGPQSRERLGGSELVIDLYRKRLDSVFEKVAPTTRHLRNSKNSPMFALLFAASNKIGASRAVKIADDILSKW